ncbi:hypothetical protein [Streptomyces sp. NBC_01462]|uniref:hypothetical protein n=1 Tax=Streptomyces sp. NBC_01462 TaxID=2903876 RepID=UPI002E30F8BC|nr:hypothetical protein [Streptomyces sp. NBC_01462]
MLTDPADHGIDLDRTVVLYMATGSEWPETRLLAEEFMLALLREHGVRFVQLARNGHLAADGITVLDDSRHPERLHARGAWTLWEEMESVGTVPQVAGTRKCSLRAKADVGDRWIGAAMGGRPFRQIIGFNADEAPRSLKDEANSKVPGRTGAFPLIDWGWGRQACEAYLLERFGVHWPKSYCTFCYFSASMGSLPAHLERMRDHPEIAGEVLRLEYTAMSLNPNAKLLGRDRCAVPRGFHRVEDLTGRPPPVPAGPRARLGRPHGPGQLPPAPAHRAGLRLHHGRRHLPRLRPRHQPPAPPGVDERTPHRPHPVRRPGMTILAATGAFLLDGLAPVPTAVAVSGQSGSRRLDTGHARRVSWGWDR